MLANYAMRTQLNRLFEVAYKEDKVLYVRIRFSDGWTVVRAVVAVHSDYMETCSATFDSEETFSVDLKDATCPYMTPFAFISDLQLLQGA